MRSISTLSLLLPAASYGLQLPTAPRAGASAASLVVPRAAPPVMFDVDMSTVVGLGAAFVGIGGGIGLIAFTENAGKRNDAQENAQPCVECKSAKVVSCTICKGTGSDPLASYVAGVRDMAGEGAGDAVPTVTIDDWEDGEKQVVMFEEILKNYPPKTTESVCLACDGRGIIVCDNCQGTGIQPRFLERYSPDDFMD